jgi:hypothetical protein
VSPKDEKQVEVFEETHEKFCKLICKLHEKPYYITY